MRFKHVAIEAFAYALPETSVTTSDIEAALAPLYARVALSPGWIEGLTGVTERRFWPTDVRPWQKAAEAGAMAMDAAGLARSELDVLISTAVCRDVLEPSVASSVHSALQLGENTRNFDLANACLGFVSGLSMAGALIEAGLVRTALVVAGEGSREVVEATIERMLQPDVDKSRYYANLATFTLGSAAVAAVVRDARSSRTSHRLLGEVALADTGANHLCRGDLNGMETDGRKLLEAGVDLGGRTWAKAKQHFSWGERPLAAYATHQVGKTHFKTITSALGIPIERAPETYATLGNTGAAGVPLALIKAIELGMLSEGDELALLGIGSGLNCAIQGVRW